MPPYNNTPSGKCPAFSTDPDRISDDPDAGRQTGIGEKWGGDAPSLARDEERRPGVGRERERARGEPEREALGARAERDEGVDRERGEAVGRAAAPCCVCCAEDCAARAG